MKATILEETEDDFTIEIDDGKSKLIYVISKVKDSVDLEIQIEENG